MLDTIYLSAAELFPLTQSTLRGLHGQLLRHFPSADFHSGAYKTSTNRVVSFNHNTNKSNVVLEPAPPGVVTEMSMQELVDWYNGQIQSSIWPLMVATEFVFRFLAIHPFQDGNGRLGRGLFVMALLQSGDPHLQAVIPYVSIDRKIEQNRARYYTVLREASSGFFQEDPSKYNLMPLHQFFIRLLNDALADIDFNLKRYTDRQALSQNGRIIWHAFKDFPQTRLSISQLEKITGLPRRTVQYSLRSLTKINFLQRLGQGAATQYQLVF
ncbi:MAG: Fic family protein [Proteobacteria bacterium]|nr:Fic family protein [Pseudomonadota bacterium]